MWNTPLLRAPINGVRVLVPSLCGKSLPAKFTPWLTPPNCRQPICRLQNESEINWQSRVEIQPMRRSQEFCLVFTSEHSIYHVIVPNPHSVHIMSSIDYQHKRVDCSSEVNMHSIWAIGPFWIGESQLCILIESRVTGLSAVIILQNANVETNSPLFYTQPTLVKIGLLVSPASYCVHS